MKKNRVFLLLWILVLTFGLVLSGCPTDSNPGGVTNGGDNGDNGDNGDGGDGGNGVIETLDITGTVYNLEIGMGSLFVGAPPTKVVTGFTGKVDAISKDSAGAVFATGTIATGGQLSITLPKPSDATLNSAIIPDGLTLNPSDTKAFVVDGFITSPKELVYGYMDFSTFPTTGMANTGEVAYLYADKAATLEGTLVDDGVTVTVSTSLKPGWNKILIVVDSTVGMGFGDGDLPISGTGTMTTGEPTAAYYWFLDPDDE
jgi:hypothetical protein